ncbi:MAG: sigma-54-dependent Fis family transcriptional regulator [Sphingobacteriales bacterium]|jgi:DNA-binding NtrC family response regulator|nr:sigma-54-dependent Fis family transcriptional regulator [Sphingobacteriales bacterium]MBP9142204.1 sigma-54-dependent Fis family transcriptional regulator [Chitinophagales bacterium]MDA0199051.1 sigma-54 dependent transcriptional regulator [Bacteroidota bacterium]MBK6889677.1 sigma-54-dependent Fis family transcriptional regulator [Sphingobacteriales bacterium]MBK7527810.1 sigma-54-dependent Fis family transcriptional regulator [Sphingobacteriales bacterium]
MDIQSIKQRFGIVGNSPSLSNALSVALRVAPTDLSVLILGESGVGKEVFSQIIHNVSPRKHNPFIAVNCGAIPEGTIDSELFGHEKGAFTSAHEKRNGYFEVCNSGTIFLDEIGEMPLGTQSRLLRVLETGEFIKVGSSKVQHTNVRVIAATNVNLIEAVRNGKFREDLYYRLNTVPIEIPPLRERKEDIYLLFRKFSVTFAEKNRIQPISLDEAAREVLQNYHWPGNVRELKNVAEQATVLSPERNLGVHEITQFIPRNSTALTRLPFGNDDTSGATNNNSHAGYNERELLYKILFDMRKEIAELKHVVMHLSGQEGNSVLSGNNATWADEPLSTAFPANTHKMASSTNPNLQQPIIINSGASNYHRGTNNNTTDNFNTPVEVEDTLSIEEKEKELIQRALRKHRGRRKDAATDLGISERTLYRKIKEYDIKE